MRQISYNPLEKERVEEGDGQLKCTLTLFSTCWIPKTDNSWRREGLGLCFLCNEPMFYCVSPAYQQECEATIVKLTHWLIDSVTYFSAFIASLGFSTSRLLVSLCYICLSVLSICLPAWKEACLKGKCLYYWLINLWAKMRKSPVGAMPFHFRTQHGSLSCFMTFYDNCTYEGATSY